MALSKADLAAIADMIAAALAPVVASAQAPAAPKVKSPVTQLADAGGWTYGDDATVYATRNDALRAHGPVAACGKRFTSQKGLDDHNAWHHKA